MRRRSRTAARWACSNSWSAGPILRARPTRSRGCARITARCARRTAPLRTQTMPIPISSTGPARITARTTRAFSASSARTTQRSSSPSRRPSVRGRTPHVESMTLRARSRNAAHTLRKPRHTRPVRRKEVPGLAGPLSVDDGGRGGVPVVFVHSFGGTLSHWSAQLEHLRPHRRAIAFDLRGHGRSPAPPDLAYAVESLAEDISGGADAPPAPPLVL